MTWPADLWHYQAIRTDVSPWSGGLPTATGVLKAPKIKEPNSWACADSWRGSSKCVGPTCCSSPPVGGLTVAMDIEGILCMAFNVCMRRFNNIHLSGTPQHHLSLVNTRWIPYCYASFLGNTTLHWFRRYPGPFRGNSWLPLIVLWSLEYSTVLLPSTEFAGSPNSLSSF